MLEDAAFQILPDLSTDLEPEDDGEEAGTPEPEPTDDQESDLADPEPVFDDDPFDDDIDLDLITQIIPTTTLEKELS